MAKIVNDKYYTPVELAKRLIDKTYEVIGKENISDVIEPSAGNGSFSLQIPNTCLAYDIEPEDDSIIKQDFLTLDYGYLWGRLIIGNPPFGTRNTLSVKFFKKAIQLGDYVAFIQPISQLDNNQQMYEFDLAYSEDLGIIKYSDRNLHCCFNIYKRSDNGGLNEKKNYKLKDVEVKEYRRGGSYKKPTHWDYAICSWGNGSCGNLVEYVGQYAQEQYISILNESYRDAVMKVCETTDWKNLYNSVAGKKIQTWKIYKYLKEQIPQLN